MSKVIRIVFNESDDAIKKGNFFEKLIAEVFSNQRYTIRERVNYTGMEIDLIAEHKDRIHEQIYIECKAKNRLESKDIKSFFFNAKFKKAKYGYFLSTVDFEHQVAGLIDEIKENKEYDGLYFWGPEKIIELLEETGLILKNHNTYSNLGYITTKEILLYSYFGIYWINLLRKGTIADSFTVIDAKKHNNRVDDELVEKIINYIDELKDCKYLSYDNDSTLYKEEPDIGFKDTIAELKESKEWFDYLPASNKHFVGKIEIDEKIDDNMVRC